jgi:hypothetical protein
VTDRQAGRRSSGGHRGTDSSRVLKPKGTQLVLFGKQNRMLWSILAMNRKPCPGDVSCSTNYVNYTTQASKQANQSRAVRLSVLRANSLTCLSDYLSDLSVCLSVCLPGKQAGKQQEPGCLSVNGVPPGGPAAHLRHAPEGLHRQPSSGVAGAGGGSPGSATAGRRRPAWSRAAVRWRCRTHRRVAAAAPSQAARLSGRLCIAYLCSLSLQNCA